MFATIHASCFTVRVQLIGLEMDGLLLGYYSNTQRHVDGNEVFS
jgi:hypothetical protein